MKWYKAKTEQICSHCGELIEVATSYFGNSTSSFCQDCGKKRQTGNLQYSQKHNAYIDIAQNKTCDFCEQPSIGNIHNKSICNEHLGSVIDDQV